MTYDKDTPMIFTMEMMENEEDRKNFCELLVMDTKKLDRQNSFNALRMGEYMYQLDQLQGWRFFGHDTFKSWCHDRCTPVYR